MMHLPRPVFLAFRRISDAFKESAALAGALRADCVLVDYDEYTMLVHFDHTPNVGARVLREDVFPIDPDSGAWLDS